MGKFSLIFLFMFILGTAFCYYESPNIETKPDDDYNQDDVNVSKVEEPELWRKLRNCGGKRCRSNSRCLKTCRFKCVRRQSYDASDNVASEGIDENGKAILLKLHNDARQKVLAGQMPCADCKPFLPKATSMPDLVWDDDLADGAQKLATSHTNQHNTKTAPSGKYAKGTYGQNLYYAAQYPNAQGRENALRGAVNAWVNENATFPLNKLDSYQSNPDPDKKKAWGHFTQVIWGKTTLVGCGYSNFKNGDFWTQNVACNYYPPGNYLGEKVYEHA